MKININEDVSVSTLIRNIVNSVINKHGEITINNTKYTHLNADWEEYVFYLTDVNAPDDIGDKQVQSTAKYQQIGRAIKDKLLQNFQKVNIKWFSIRSKKYGKPYIQIQIKDKINEATRLSSIKDFKTYCNDKIICQYYHQR
jgi:hypothetical protein